MRYFVIVLMALLFSSCNEKVNDMTDFHKVYGGDSAEIYLSEISDNFVLFGHQSVGRNILSGITILEHESGVELNRLNTREYSDTATPVFIDFSVGENGDPYGKIDDFVSVVSEIPEEINAIAFFKLCYVDVVEGVDVDEIFKYYRDKMIGLKRSTDHVNIVIVTAPLSTVQKGWKALAKKVLKRQSSDYLDNIKRSEFNNLILNELSEDFPVFDLALVESTLPGGEQSTYKTNGKVYPCLSQDYASDNGHLNEFGSKIVAYNMLAFLAEDVNR